MAQRQVDLSAYIPHGVDQGHQGQGSLQRGQLFVEIDDDDGDHFSSNPQLPIACSRPAAPKPAPASRLAAPQESAPVPPPAAPQPAPASRPAAPQQSALAPRPAAPQQPAMQPGVASYTVQGTSGQAMQSGVASYTVQGASGRQQQQPTNQQGQQPPIVYQKPKSFVSVPAKPQPNH